MRPAPLFAAVLAAAALTAGLAFVSRDLWRSAPPLHFMERAEPGFRDLVSASVAEGVTAPLPPLTPAGGPLDLCTALFGDPDAPRIGAGPVTAVYFTDYRCPYCRVLGALLFERAQAGEITLIVKEWPILGPQSEAAARVALAAGKQGAFAPAHERLMGAAFAPTPAYVADLATGLGIDPVRVAADAASPQVAAELARNAALARALGLQGTPGLVIGRTVAQRSVFDRMLDALIADEAALGPAPC